MRYVRNPARNSIQAHPLLGPFSDSVVSVVVVATVVGAAVVGAAVVGAAVVGAAVAAAVVAAVVSGSCLLAWALRIAETLPWGTLPSQL